MVGHRDKYNTQKEDKLKQDKLVLQNAERPFFLSAQIHFSLLRPHHTLSNT